jgi:hypothetical protein
MMFIDGRIDRSLIRNLSIRKRQRTASIQIPFVLAKTKKASSNIQPQIRPTVVQAHLVPESIVSGLMRN